jgi:hypothetical protein
MGNRAKFKNSNRAILLDNVRFCHEFYYNCFFGRALKVARKVNLEIGGVFKRGIYGGYKQLIN